MNFVSLRLREMWSEKKRQITLSTLLLPFSSTLSGVGNFDTTSPPLPRHLLPQTLLLLDAPQRTATPLSPGGVDRVDKDASSRLFYFETSFAFSSPKAVQHTPPTPSSPRYPPTFLPADPFPQLTRPRLPRPRRPDRPEPSRPLARDSTAFSDSGGEVEGSAGSFESG